MSWVSKFGFVLCILQTMFVVPNLTACDDSARADSQLKWHQHFARPSVFELSPKKGVTCQKVELSGKTVVNKLFVKWFYQTICICGLQNTKTTFFFFCTVCIPLLFQSLSLVVMRLFTFSLTWLHFKDFL